MDNTERDDLDALISSPGWAVFCAYVAKEWGTTEGGGARFLAGVTAAASLTVDADATAQLRQVVVCQREIQKLMQWAPERLRHLIATQPPPESDAVPLSRRGSL